MQSGKREVTDISGNTRYGNEIKSFYIRKMKCHKDYQALLWIAQRGCGTYIFGDI